MRLDKSEDAIATRDAMRMTQTDAMVPPGLILPRVARLPRLGCFNIHASLLPMAQRSSTARWAGDGNQHPPLMQMDAGLAATC
jgi:methionyl-tRNA formyltransferase